MPIRMKRQARTRAAAPPATAAADARDDVRAHNSAPACAERHATDAPTRLRRWVLGSLLGVLALLPSPAGAFSADGLHSGMTLDEVKKVLISQGRNLDYMFNFDGEERFRLEKENYLIFCQNKLIGYSRHIKNADLFNYDKNELSNLIFDRISINNDDGFIINRNSYFYYRNEFYWSSGNEGGSLIFYSVMRLPSSEMSQIDAIKDKVFFNEQFPRENFRIHEKCQP